MRRIAVALAILLAAGAPAAAHKLKVFATVDGQAVRGYAFFVGGGRPEGSAWVAKDAAGNRIAAGATDGQGRFSFDLPAGMSSDVTITVDTHEAHIAATTLAATRLANAAPAPAVPASPAPAAAPAADEARLEALVSAAVGRQVAPLLERLEAMDSRLRLADIMSGIFLIIGLAGIGLWVRGRPRR